MPPRTKVKSTSHVERGRKGAAAAADKLTRDEHGHFRRREQPDDPPPAPPDTPPEPPPFVELRRKFSPIAGRMRRS